jgi:hypothetical protein
LEAPLAHPIFEPLRERIGRLENPLAMTRERLNALAEQADLRVAAGKALRFVDPGLDERPYEMRIFESGCVPTREGNLHDVFNALAWLAYPKSKAQLNAMHAAQIPHEQGRRGRLRDLLTIFDEGGAIVACDAADLIEMVRGFRWRELFWMSRSRLLEHMKIHVLGHAVLEQALKPWPGITCKAIFVPSASAQEADGHVATWLEGLPATATPQDLAPLPIFGYPGWLPDNDREAFYDDERYFRPFRRDKIPAGVGQAAAARNSARAEESPGSAERDAG